MSQPRINRNDSGLESVFAEIFREHEQRLYSLVYRLTKSEQYAKDIIQEVFLKLWECREEMDQIQNMESWLYRIAENKTIDFLRKAAADSRLREKIWGSLQQIANEAEGWVAVKEYNQIIHRAIELLPAQRRLIYQLHKEEGKNYKEIADELHISKHTVKNQLFTAVQSIRRFLARNMKSFFFIG